MVRRTCFVIVGFAGLLAAGCGEAVLELPECTTAGGTGPCAASELRVAQCAPGSVRACALPVEDRTDCSGQQKCAELGGDVAWTSCATVAAIAEVCGNGFDDDCDGLTDEHCAVDSTPGAGGAGGAGGSGSAGPTPPPPGTGGSGGSAGAGGTGSAGPTPPPPGTGGTGGSGSAGPTPPPGDGDGGTGGSGSGSPTPPPPGGSGGGGDAGDGPCESAEVRTCVASCGSYGTQLCDEDGWRACEPPDEACGNGRDDDCDGSVDEDCPECTPGMTVACTAGCGSTGSRGCEADGRWGPCVSPPEVCGNDVDDDCDGAAEEDCPECTPQLVVTCTASCGTAGGRTCSPDGRWGPCVSPPELCGNGFDDDCDGAADEDCPECTPGTRISCATTCGSSGERSCSPEGFWGSCVPPRENCGNLLDDDCDGQVEPDDADCPVYRCEDFEGGNCNSDPGYGDACDASDNTNGCSAGRFWAWCNRRNEQYPDIWYAWTRDWVAARCGGAVVQIGDTYACGASDAIYACTTPLVVSFEPDEPVRFDPGEERFPLDPALPGARTDWPSAATPWLARDRDGDGAIEDGSELFGSATPLSAGGTAGNGFEALAALDSNGDGRIDRFDPAWDELVLWRDDGDRRSRPQELQPVAEARLVAIELAFELDVRCDDRGNCERERAAMFFRSATGELRRGAVIDVHLSARLPVPGPAAQLVAAR